MGTILDRYRNDFDRLVNMGELLLIAIGAECSPDGFKAGMKKAHGTKATELMKGIPSFKETYQDWYSESKALVAQLLPDRLEDFARHYQKPKSRKAIDYENYTIEDYLQGLTVTRGLTGEKIVGPLGNHIVGLLCCADDYVQGTSCAGLSFT